jgi:hypothetical protein
MIYSTLGESCFIFEHFKNQKGMKRYDALSVKGSYIRLSLNFFRHDA